MMEGAMIHQIRRATNNSTVRLASRPHDECSVDVPYPLATWWFSEPKYGVRRFHLPCIEWQAGGQSYRYIPPAVIDDFTNNPRLNHIAMGRDVAARVQSTMTEALIAATDDGKGE